MRRVKRLGWRAIRISAWAAAAVLALRILPGATAEPSPMPSVLPDANAFRMVTYNILGTDPDPDGRLNAALVARAPAVVGLVEVTESRAQELAADPVLAELYPYQELRPYAPRGGIAILSSYPMETTPNDPTLPVLLAIVDIDGTQVSVIEAHASNPLFASGRDGELGRMRELIETQRAAGYPVVLAGDLNINDFEPAFWSLSEGLVHPASGATWGPSSGGPALLRIDHVLTTPDLAPSDAAVDCDASGSDHCLVETIVTLPGG